MSEDTAPAPVDENRKAFRRLASDGRFRLLWSAQFISGIGDWLIIGLLVPMVGTLSGGSSFAVAGIMIAKIIPALVLSSMTGALIDRFDRRKTMIAADAARCVLVLLLLSTNSLFAIYAVVLLMETASLFFVPARNALVPYFVDERDITAANGFMYTTQQAAMLVGLAASGAILAGFEAIVHAIMAAKLPVVDYFVGLAAPALLGPRAGFFLDALTFVFSFSMLSAIRIHAKPPSSGGEFSLSLLGRDALDSFRFLRDHRELRGLLVTVFLAILGGGAIIPVGMDYVKSLVGRDAIARGIPWLQQLTGTPQTFMLVFMAVGMVLGATLVPRMSRTLPLKTLFTGSVALFGGALFGFASVDRYWVAGTFAAVAGGCIAMLTVAGNSYVVQTTEDAIRGRVFTAMESVIRVALLLSMIVMAPLNDLIGKVMLRVVERNGLAPHTMALTGPRVTLQLSAGIVLLAAVYGVTTMRWRECDRETESEAGHA